MKNYLYITFKRMLAQIRMKKKVTIMLIKEFLNLGYSQDMNVQYRFLYQYGSYLGNTTWNRIQCW